MYFTMETCDHGIPQLYVQHLTNRQGEWGSIAYASLGHSPCASPDDSPCASLAKLEKRTHFLTVESVTKLQDVRKPCSQIPTDMYIE